MNELNNVRVAAIATDGVEQVELTEPAKALRDAGARVDVISPQGEKIQGFNHTDKANTISADRSLEDISPNEYDAVLLPGGAVNADFVRALPKQKEFLRAMDRDGKPFAVICHAPWELISAGIAQGRKMTSYHTIQDDVRNAGAYWVDEEVVVDGNLVTSRKPTDIPAFNREIIELFSRVPAVAST